MHLLPFPIFDLFLDTSRPLMKCILRWNLLRSFRWRNCHHHFLKRVTEDLQQLDWRTDWLIKSEALKMFGIQLSEGRPCDRPAHWLNPIIKSINIAISIATLTTYSARFDYHRQQTGLFKIHPKAEKCFKKVDKLQSKPSKSNFS